MRIDSRSLDLSVGSPHDQCSLPGGVPARRVAESGKKEKARRQKSDFSQATISVDERQQSQAGSLLIGAILVAEFADEKFFFSADPGDDGYAHRRR